MFDYRIPQEIKTRLTKGFAIDFLNKLNVIFDLTHPVSLGFLVNFESTCGWVDAFKCACQKYDMEDVFAYYDQLEWYDSDLFDDEFASLIAEYGLIKK